MIEYTLKRNELTGEPIKYRAQVVNSRSYTFDDIAEHLINNNVGLSQAAIYGLWESIKKTVEEFIANGGSINTELFHAHASIRGVFERMDDGFDGSRHEIRLNLRPGSLLRAIPNRLQVKRRYSGTKSVILSVTDANTGSVDSFLTPGKIVKIVGRRVKIDGDDPTNGLYFVPKDGSEHQVKINASDLAVNNPSALIAIVPNLCGCTTWNLKLVTQYCNGNKFLKIPYSIISEKEFCVAAV